MLAGAAMGTSVGRRTSLTACPLTFWEGTRMKTFGRFAISIGAAALMASCGAAQPPIGVPLDAQNPLPARAVPLSPSAATSTNLLYVADNVSGIVQVLTYPKGKPAQTLTGFDSLTGECVDGVGDVFITDTKQGGSGYVYEYAHGGSEPIATLSDPFTWPAGCAVDPTSGDLALVSFGGIAIFPHASGNPVTYTDSNFATMRYDGYDMNGNLFIDGYAPSGNSFTFAELAHGSTSLNNITIAGTLDEAGAVQWDGQYITVMTVAGPRGRSPVIDRLQVNGSSASIAGTTTLNNHRKRYNGGQFWIQNNRVIGPSQNGGAVSIWAYPSGGKPTKTIKDMGPDAWGVAVSAEP